MRKCDGGGVKIWTAVHDRDPVDSVFAVNSEASRLPVDQGVNHVEKRNSEDQCWVHRHYAQVQVEANRVHSHVDVHEFCAGESAARCSGEGLSRMQPMAFELELPCSLFRNKIRACATVQ